MNISFDKNYIKTNEILIIGSQWICLNNPIRLEVSFNEITIISKAAIELILMMEKFEKTKYRNINQIIIVNRKFLL